MNEGTFIILPWSSDHPLVEAWSAERLQYDSPKPSQRALRNELASAVRGIEPADALLLDGTYTSPSADFVDTENVLFYNVNTTVFSRIANNGLRFERMFGLPPLSPAPMVTPALHYHRYGLIQRRSAFRCWDEGPVLASWSGLRLSALDDETPATPVWYALTQSELDVKRRRSDQALPFGVRVRLLAPLAARRRNAAALVKPLLDGILCGFHAHSGRDLDEISARVATRLDRPSDEIACLLSSDQRAVLGTRRLLHKWGRSVQWNPADELCVAAELTIESSEDRSGDWEAEGELFEVHPAAPV